MAFVASGPLPSQSRKTCQWIQSSPLPSKPHRRPFSYPAGARPRATVKAVDTAPKLIVTPRRTPEDLRPKEPVFVPLSPHPPEELQAPPVRNGFLAHAWPRALLVLVAALWGTNFACVKLVGESMTPADGSLARFALASLALAPAFFLGPKIGGTKRREPAMPPGLLTDGLRCGLWVFLGYMTQSIALQTTDAGKSAFICSLAVVFVPFVTSILNRFSPTEEKAAKPSWMAAFLAAAGVGIMELGGQNALHVQAGDLWALGQMVGFSMGFIESERALSRFPRHPLQITAIQLTFVAAASFVWALGASSLQTGTFAFPDLSAVVGAHASLTVIGAVAFTGLITTAFTIFIESIALVHVSASEMAVILSTEPLFATAFAAFLLHETVGPEAAMGGGLIMMACLVKELHVSMVRLVLSAVLANFVWLLGDRAKDIV